MKQFNELTEEELKQLQEQIDKRDKEENRDLLKDVICVWVGNYQGVDRE